MFQNAAALVPAVTGPGSQAGAGQEALLLPWRDIPAILNRRKGWIVGSLLAAVAVGALLAAALPRSYTATTELLVEPTDLRATDNAVSQKPTEAENTVAQIESVARVVGSTSVLNRVVAKERLDHDPEFVGGPSFIGTLNAELRAVLGGGPAPARDPVALALQQLDKRLVIKRSERTYVIDVAVRSKDPDKAARLANDIVAAYLDVQSAARADAAKRISDSLGSRLGELRQKLQTAEDAVQAYKVAHRLVMANGQLVNEQQIADASNQLLTAETRTADARARLDAIERGGDPASAAESLQSPTITALRTQLAQVSKQQADLLPTLGPRHPQMAQIQSQVADVRRSLNAEVERIRNGAREAYERARGNEATLRANLERRQTSGTQVTAAMATLRELQQAADTSRGVYQSFLQRSRETAEQEQVDTTNAFVMSPAEPPIDRSFPPPNVLILAGALALGLFAGLALALLREALDQRIWTAGRAESATGAPVLAVVDARARRRGLLRRRATTAATDEAMAVLLGDLSAGLPSASARVVLLIGGRDGAGVDAVGTRLAAAAAEAGERTLLVRLAAGARVPAATLSAAPGLRVMDVLEGGGLRQAQAGVLQLKTALARQPDLGLVVVTAHRTAMPLAQLGEIADDIVLVVLAERTTQNEARAMTDRLRPTMKRVRGSVFVLGTT